MSGGSYDYLFTKEFERYDEPPDDPDASPLRRMYWRIRDINNMYNASDLAEIHMASLLASLNNAAYYADLLRDVWHAVEWRDSSDWGDDQMLAVLRAYGNQDDS